MAEKEVWVFGGEGCEQCGAMAGEYDYNPGRPHPNCDCSLTHVKIEERCLVVDEEELGRELVDELAEPLYPADETYGTRYWVFQQWLVYVLQELSCCEVRNGQVTRNCHARFEGKERLEWEDAGLVENWRGQGVPAGTQL